MNNPIKMQKCSSIGEGNVIIAEASSCQQVMTPNCKSDLDKIKQSSATDESLVMESTETEGSSRNTSCNNSPAGSSQELNKKISSHSNSMNSTPSPEIKLFQNGNYVGAKRQIGFRDDTYLKIGEGVSNTKGSELSNCGSSILGGGRTRTV